MQVIFWGLVWSQRWWQTAQRLPACCYGVILSCVLLICGCVILDRVWRSACVLDLEFESRLKSLCSTNSSPHLWHEVGPENASIDDRSDGVTWGTLTSVLQMQKQISLPFKPFTVVVRGVSIHLTGTFSTLSTDHLSDKGNSLNYISCEKPLSASVLWRMSCPCGINRAAHPVHAQ